MLTPQLGLGRRLLQAMRTGAALGVPVGLAVVLVVQLTDSSHLNFLAWAISLCVAAMSGAVGLILWGSAAAYAWRARNYAKTDETMSQHTAWSWNAGWWASGRSARPSAFWSLLALTRARSCSDVGGGRLS